MAAEAGISRERARAIILAGGVRVEGVPQRSVAFGVAPGSRLEIVQDRRFVGRGGLKLERALDEFAWSVRALRCLDIGASTGGFTDCLLQRGAASVTAVDVGYGHLAWSLRQDSRVTVLERTNFRHAEPAALGPPYDIACIDVSFISLTKLAAQLRTALKRDGKVVALVKPQFEVGRTAVGRGGVIRDPAAHEAAVSSVITSFTGADLACVALTYSPVKGPAGNIEFLLGAVAGGSASAQLDVAGVVERAHEALDR